MSDWDPATISAVAALVVSCFALLVTIAQAVQQYLVTGQLIRLCDSVVYGPLPGQASSSGLVYPKLLCWNVLVEL
jgi:hypothetical protein